MGLFNNLAIGTWVWLSTEKVNHSPHQFVPLLLVVFPQVFSYVMYAIVHLLYTTVDVAFLWVRY